MAKAKSQWVCEQCGFQTARFLGRCTECSSWNSLVEELIVEPGASLSAKLNSRTKQELGKNHPILLAKVESDDTFRIATGLPSVDEVLGGGIVPGSVVLLAGDPGVGKSTLLLQILEIIGSSCAVLYITGEESAQQVKLRADRLAIEAGEILICAEQNISSIESMLMNTKAKVVVVDSIQAVFHPELSSAPGSVSQVRESTAALISIAKSKNIAVILVGHVTKDGSIAGPRVLEHMVDVVLQFEGERTRQLRLLRAAKNRFGSTAEMAVFTMSDKGLVEVDNPSSLFLGIRQASFDGEAAPSGTAVIAGGEGNKVLLLEVQALVGSSPYPSPRRIANGFDVTRLQQILAVLEKKVGMCLSRFDAYVNVVGGFEYSDPAGDLGVALALATSSLDLSMDPRLIVLGEVGLTGEVRPVVSLDRRLKEAARMGFRKAIVPEANLPLNMNVGIETIGVQYLKEALEIAIPGYAETRENASLVKERSSQAGFAEASY